MDMLKIAWHDPQISNQENSSYISIFPFNYELRAFSEADETIRFLKDEISPWVLVTSGTNGEALVRSVGRYQSVIGIIIFCMNKKKHKKWALRYQKVKQVVNRGFYEVLDHASNIFNNHVAHAALQLIQDPSEGASSLMYALDPNPPPNQINSPMYYYHMQTELEMSFLMIIKLAIKNETISRKKVLGEFLALNPSNEVKNVFNKNKKDLLRSIIYTYTTNSIYRELNQCYASNNFRRVVNITAASLLELQERKDTLMLKEKTVLYRGVDIPEDRLADYNIGQSGYWSAFSSTTTDETVSRNPPFGGNVQFEIHLSEAIAHPHVVLPYGWSMFNKENEVLLFPYFPFVIEKIEDLGSYIKITVHQNEQHPSLAFNSEIFTDYWLNRIINEVSTPFNDLCKQIHLRIDRSIDYHSYFYNQNPQYQSTTQFQRDLERSIDSVYGIRIKIHSYRDRFDNNISIINYWKILKDDIIESMSKYLRKKINELFQDDFNNMEKKIKTVMKEEMVTAFKIPLEIFYECIRPIFDKAEKYLTQSETSINHNSMQASDGYILHFCQVVIRSMSIVMEEQSSNIDITTEKVKNELTAQLNELEKKIGRVLGELWF